MNQPRDVVITGVGVISPIGTGVDAFWSSLTEQKSGVVLREEFEGFDGCYRIGAPAAEFEPKKYVKPRKSLKVMCREIQMGCTAAAMAMEVAGFEPETLSPDRLGSVFGSELYYCLLSEMEEVYRNCLVDGRFHYELWGERAMSDIAPLWMLKHLPNMTSCHIGIVNDGRGPNNTIMMEEVSSLLAVVEAASYIQRGLADVMLCGGSGVRMNVTTQVYRCEMDLSRRIDSPQQASRPFDKDRDGMVVGEGCAAFVLETLESAKARNATVLARVAGYGRVHAGKGDLSGAVARSIERAVEAADLSASDVGAVKANGRSTVDDDRAEAAGIRQALGDVPVTAPTSNFGYLGSGSGAVEMAAGLMSLTHGQIPATLNYETPDRDCPINVVHGDSHELQKPAMMVLNQSPTGQAVSVLLTRD